MLIGLLVAENQKSALAAACTACRKQQAAACCKQQAAAWFPSFAAGGILCVQMRDRKICDIYITTSGPSLTELWCPGVPVQHRLAPRPSPCTNDLIGTGFYPWRGGGLGKEGEGGFNRYTASTGVIGNTNKAGFCRQADAYQ